MESFSIDVIKTTFFSVTGYENLKDRLEAFIQEEDVTEISFQYKDQEITIEPAGSDYQLRISGEFKGYFSRMDILFGRIEEHIKEEALERGV